MKHKFLFCLSLILGLLAVVTGGSSLMAMALDPLPDDHGEETQIPGTTASASNLDEGDLIRKETDDRIASFRPFNFPLETDVRRDAQVRVVKNYEQRHYSTGQEVLDYELKDTVNGGEIAVITSTSLGGSRYLAMFPKDVTFICPEIQGYAEDGVTKDGCLMCAVTEKTATEVKFEALNGAKAAPEDKGVVPSLPVGTKISICANACSESQLVVEPENYQPRPKLVYLQKKIVNVVITDEFKKVVKEVPLMEQDIREDALYKFRRKSAKSLWISAKSKRSVNQGGTMGDELVYTSEGVLRQVDRMYGIGDELSYADLIGICKMQFTTNAVSNEANAYCGKNFMEKLLNIDFTKHKDVQFTAGTVLGVDIKAFKCSFGTLNFKYDPTLDDIGFQDYCVVLDIKNAVRYVKENNKNKTIDMSQGVGDAREAQRDVTIEIDALALRGYNSILVGKGGDLVNRWAPNTEVNVTTVAALPATPNDGQVVFLTSADGGFTANTLLEYSKASGKWEEYTGVINA
jgi:hypothetical protein